MDGVGDLEPRVAAVPVAPRGSALRAITTRECLDLLRDGTIGRLGLTDRALPMILPVRFRVHNDWVVVRTDPLGTMAQAARDAVVAFEVDQVESGTGRGWSVVVLGHASLVTDGPTHAALSCLDLPDWTTDGSDGHLVIKMERVSGRRLDFGAETGTGIQN